ncbi:MAG: hypothetical protein B7X54_04755 [Idiomarina sp. 34-48-12]|nr:MAG: hypothetical protein B7X54_04755 [Idiomarina sp. 34-48-12]
MKNISFTNEYGQGIIELVLILGVVSITLSMSITKLHDALYSQHQELDVLRSEILQPLPNKAWQRAPSDQFSRHVKPILSPLNRITELELDLDNLYYVGSDQSPYRLARLIDGWPQGSNEALISAPQSLTLSHYLNRVGLTTILHVVGQLPISRELKRDSLILGKIDTDITPHELRCEDPACH